MEKKKLKLTISGSSKKTINNFELAKSQGKNSVVIEKKILDLDQNLLILETPIREIHLANLKLISFLEIIQFQNHPQPMTLKREN